MQVDDPQLPREPSGPHCRLDLPGVAIRVLPLLGPLSGGQVIVNVEGHHLKRQLQEGVYKDRVDIRRCPLPSVGEALSPLWGKPSALLSINLTCLAAVLPIVLPPS